MNPNISIVVDAKNKAISTLTGMVTVGSKVDVEISGIASSDVPNWGSDDKFTGPSIRFRVVDPCGHDLVRYQLHEKTDTSPDVWTWDSANSKFTATNVDFNTDLLRKEFKCVPFNESVEFGVIIDSIVDSAQYAIGKIKIRQWSAASTEDPTVLPDWRATLVKLQADLANVEQSKTDAQTYSSQALSAKNDAVEAKSQAQGSAQSAQYYNNAAAQNAASAHDERVLAQSAKASAEAAKLAAEVAVTHYPKIGANENWFVWDSVNGVWVDTGYCANGGHNIFNGKVFSRPTNAKGWYELLAYLLIEMGGNIQTEGITPGSSPSAITMTATDGQSKQLKIVKSDGEYTTEVM